MGPAALSAFAQFPPGNLFIAATFAPLPKAFNVRGDFTQLHLLRALSGSCWWGAEEAMVVWADEYQVLAV